LQDAAANVEMFINNVVAHCILQIGLYIVNI